MSISTLSEALSRIQVAEQGSAIAVFKGKTPGQVITLFSATIKTSEMIKENPPDLIGVFDRSMDLTDVSQKIKEAIAEE